jgi:hypothetical protein
MSASRSTETSKRGSTSQRQLSPGRSLAVLLVGLAGFVWIPFIAASDASQHHVASGTIHLVLAISMGVGVAVVVGYVYVQPLWRTGRPRPARAPQWKSPNIAALPVLVVAALGLFFGPPLVALPAAGLLGGLTITGILVALIRVIRMIATNTWPTR